MPMTPRGHDSCVGLGFCGLGFRLFSVGVTEVIALYSIPRGATRWFRKGDGPKRVLQVLLCGGSGFRVCMILLLLLLL